MVSRDLKIIGIILFFIFTLFSFSFSEEETFTITTYYPSPYGSYNELTTYSNTYLATEDGNVGIGTSDPKQKLEIVGPTGNIQFDLNSYSGYTVLRSNPINDALGHGELAINAEYNGDWLTFYGDQGIQLRSPFADPAITIIRSGNVGIGTSSPGAKLSVVGTNGFEPTLWGPSILVLVKFGSASGTIPLGIRQNAPESGTPTLVGFETANGSLGSIDAGGVNIFSIGAASGKSLALGANASTNIFINTNGNVGIGTASPGAQLEVDGQVKITGGSPGTNKVLTSDAAGLASWQTPSLDSAERGTYWTTYPNPGEETKCPAGQYMCGVTARSGGNWRELGIICCGK